MFNMTDENEQNIQQLRAKLDCTTSELSRIKQLLNKKVRYVSLNIKY